MGFNEYATAEALRAVTTDTAFIFYYETHPVRGDAHELFWPQRHSKSRLVVSNAIPAALIDHDR